MVAASFLCIQSVNPDAGGTQRPGQQQEQHSSFGAANKSKILALKSLATIAQGSDALCEAILHTLIDAIPGALADVARKGEISIFCAQLICPGNAACE